MALAKAPSLQSYIVQNAEPTDTTLGTGAYGCVIEFTINGALCAGKKIHATLLGGQDGELNVVEEKFKKECELLASLRHPNVVQYLGLAFLPGASLPCLLMERLYCSLDDYLEKRGSIDYQPNIPFPLKRSILLDVSSALAYLHNHDPPVIHCDLTSRNVLLTHVMTAKLADLGNSRLIDMRKVTKTMTTAPGTLLYMPPEALAEKCHYTSKLDIFSFGHLSLYVLTQIFPSNLLAPSEPDPKNPDVLIPRNEVERRIKYFVMLQCKFYENKYQAFIKLIKDCLHNAPGKRPDTATIHKFLREFPVGTVDDPHAALTEIAFMESGQWPEGKMSTETDVRKKTLSTPQKMGMINRCRSAGLMQFGRKVNTIVVLKVTGEKQLQICKPHDRRARPQEQVELSEVKEVEPIPGDTFSFNIHFKNKKINPWQFDALTEEDRTSWIEAIMHVPQEMVKEKATDENTNEDKKYKNEKQTKETPENEYKIVPSPIIDTRRVVTMQITRPLKQNSPVAPRRNTVNETKRMLPPQKADLLRQGNVNPNQKRELYHLSPSSIDTSLYDEIASDDLPPNPRPRSKGLSPRMKRRGHVQRACIESQEKLGTSTVGDEYPYYEQIDEVYPTRNTTDRRKFPLPLPLDNKMTQYCNSALSPDAASLTNSLPSFPGKQRPPMQSAGSTRSLTDSLPSSPKYPSGGMSSPTLFTVANQASQYFDPRQMSLLIQMFQKMQEYLEPAYSEITSSYQNQVQSDGHQKVKPQRQMPEQWLRQDEDDGEEYIPRPEWVKAAVSATSDLNALPGFEDNILIISPSKLSNIQEIGNGRYGKIYKASLQRSANDSIDVALKTTKAYSENETKNFKREMAMISKMMHPNIVSLYGVVHEGAYAPSIILEFHHYGDLKNFLMKYERPHQQLMKYMVDIAMGMHYISEKGLVHRDLAARNVLVGANETCKISDFGLLRELPKDDSIYTSHSNIPCLIRWMPPESIVDRTFSPASDVWSFGIVQWEMFNPNKNPYSGMVDTQCAVKIVNGYTLPVPRGCPPIVSKTMRSCWSKEPSKRPSFFLLATILSKVTLN